MPDKYDYIIGVEELDRHLGEFRFEAKVTHLVKNPGDNSERLPVPLHIWWGKTRREAEDKAKVEIEQWIAQQNKE